MYAGDIATDPQFAYTTGYYWGDYLIGNDSVTDRGMFLFKMDHNGNYIHASGIHYDLRPEHISNIQNGSMVISGRFYGNAYIDNLVLMGGSGVSRFIALYTDPLSSVGSYHVNKTGISLFPNPNSGEFTLQGTEGPYTLTINNLLGEQEAVVSGEDTHLQCQLEKGLHLYTIKQRDAVFSGKLVIQ